MKMIFSITVALLVASCASGLSGLQQTLTNTTSAANAAVLAFETFDKSHQEAIVKAYQNNNPIMTDNAIAKYRVARQPIIAAFAALEIAVTVAKALEKSTDTKQIGAAITAIINATQPITTGLSALGSVGL